MGDLKSMKTIMMLKICRELPVIYIPTAFIGRDLAGAIASSQAFFNFRVSVCSAVGALCAGGCLEALPRYVLY